VTAQAEHRGRYHTDRQPFTLHHIPKCPAAPPPDVARAAGRKLRDHNGGIVTLDVYDRTLAVDTSGA